MRKTFPIILVILAGCSTSDSTSPDNNVPSPRQAALVKVVEPAPVTTGRISNLSATSCRKGPAAPLPSRDDALLLLKTRALMNGYIALHSVTIGPVSPSLAKSCSQGIQARGVGFTPS